jgi:O-antigen/teichoic acid export membrane protein
MSPDFYKAAGSRVFATISSLIAGIISLKLYSRYLNPEVYGVVLVAMQLINYLPLLDGGFRSTVNRRLLAQPDPAQQRRLIRFCQVFYSILGVIVLLSGAALMSGYSFTSAARASGESYFFFLTLGIAGALTVIASVQIALLVGLKEQGSLFLLAGLNSWASLAAMWFGLHAGAGVWSFPLSLAGGLCVVYPTACWLIRQRIPDVQFFSFRTDTEFRSDFRLLRPDAWTFFRSEVATVLLYTIDVIAVGLICGSRDAAVYGVLVRLFSIIRSFLQTSGEAAWPIIAHKGLDSSGFSTPLLRMNAWIYGSVMGAVCPTLLPFCQWFLGAAWVSSPAVLYLSVARYLVTGLATPASYFLFGLGEIQSITRCIQRELIAACIIAVWLGLAFGLVGIIAGFLAATAFGTLYPLPAAFARISGHPPRDLFFHQWWRGLTGLLLGWIGARYALGYFPTGSGTVIAGLTGFLCGISAALGIAAFRRRLALPTAPVTTRVLALIKNL